MGAPSRHRSNILNAAVTLFRRRGYAATGLNDILQESRAPKGSLYHYFPQGKEQLGEEAALLAGSVVSQTLRTLAAEQPSAAEVMRAYGRMLAGWLEASAFKDGCPLATTLLETTPQSPRMAAAGQQAFNQWAAEIRGVLERQGADRETARRLAQLAIAAIEGALIQARVESSARPVLESTEEIAFLIEARLAKCE
ncbi:TetR/AcrR family transcriptional regulator [Halopseudomonas pelagia]|uniref:TetR/AcrR family transcriptional regulator n=1 Tax=Halopseudomonas pelagia TaxID=553151 RepID=UPI00039A7B48|nr:TetR/AcrR family transcriptional regulator [Halopseudomonas pelagia]|tara:strand:- start:786 stop:1373 length:588 start_codon:yes stop_codon:yes gene_type:complete